MLFNSPVYIFIFLPFVLCVYLFLTRIEKTTCAKVFLVAASLTFYGYWNPAYSGLLLSSITVNFFVGRYLQTSFGKSENQTFWTRKRLATLGVLFNVGLLAYYKYTNFFIDTLNQLSVVNAQLLTIALPLAISFFTFQQIAFLVDCYREKTRVYSLLDYALFVTFFPQLIAGPIVHHKQMMPQFLRASHLSVNWQNISVGLTIFFIGLFKKVVIADTFSVWANTGFATPESLSFYEAWATSLCYTFQLYYDFSGYTDMAIGAALLFNIKLPINFNSPYKALSIQDFWRRWHMTLSNWLRYYVYIALGGNRIGGFKTYRNLFLTFLIGGLWHGAGWTFIIWGALHGAALVIHRIWNRAGFVLPSIVAWFVTFMFVNATWVFFRADNTNDALMILYAMLNVETAYFSHEFVALLQYLSPLPLFAFEGQSHSSFISIQILMFLLIFGLICMLSPNSIQIVRYIPYQGRLALNASPFTGLFLALIAGLSIMTFFGDASPAEFLYFNF